MSTRFGGLLPGRSGLGSMALAIVAGGLLVGCATTGDQPFRGRWWSFYERGSTRLQAGAWEEAATDFRAAAAVRGRDQHWARTYGLHLLRDYFPNRDLGIALYRQGRVDEAIGILEKSLEMTFTGAGAYFLDQARRDRVLVGNLDGAPPVIEVLAPGLETTVGDLGVKVTAAISDDTYVSIVTINGLPASPRVSSPRHEVEQFVSLHPGANTIRLEATDISGKITRRDIALSADHDGPAIRLDEPIQLPGVISGLARDGSGVTQVMVGDQEATLTAEPGGLYRFWASVGTDSLTRPLQCAAEDVHGNKTILAVPGIGENLALAANISPGAFPSAFAELLVLANPFEGVAGHPAPDSVIEFNHVPDLRVYVDSIRVQVAVSSAGTDDKFHLLVGPEAPSASNAIALIPGSTRQVVSRRVSLADGENTITARLARPDGEAAQSTLRVTRLTPPYELPEYRLSAALLFPVWLENSSVDPAVSGNVYRNFEKAMDSRFTVLDRQEAFQNLLVERQVSSANLASAESRLQLGELLNAEVLIEGKIRMIDDQIIGISADIINSETSAKRAMIDVAGPAANHEALATELAELLKQAYPRVPGYVLKTLDDRAALTSLGTADGVKPDMRCVFYIYGDEVTEISPFTQTMESYGRPAVVVGHGRITDLQQKSGTAVQVPLEDANPAPWPELATDDYLWVITK